MNIYEKLSRCSSPGEVERMIRGNNFSLAAPDTVAERDRLQKLIIDFQEWCRVERAALGAIDGYDYDSGQEYGLRRAEIEVEKRLRSIRSDSGQSIHRGKKP